MVKLTAKSLRVSDLSTRLSSIRGLFSSDRILVEKYLGRLVFSKSPSDNPACMQITVDHRYLVPASTGYSYEAVSNPYCVTTEATMGWTVTTRDAMGRVTQSSTYGGATVPGPWTSGYSTPAKGTSTVAYSAEWTTVGDQAGKKRKNRVDGLGRLVEGVEDPDSLAYSTTYGYDHRDALTTAKQTRKVPAADGSGCGAAGTTILYSNGQIDGRGIFGGDDAVYGLGFAGSGIEV